MVSVNEDRFAEQRRIIAVAAYYRMSSDDQSASISQQQKDCREFARLRGWEIVAEFIDSGKSGSKEIEKRVQFHKMIADSAKGEWAAVLVWDSSRFARLDTLDAAPFKSVLRKNGVHLESVKEGRIDWNTSMGRLQDAMMSESNSEYSKKLAGAVLRGRLHVLEAGYWPHGTIPYGYSRELVENGVVKMVVPRTEIFRKPKNWKLRLVIFEKEAKAVRWVFENYSKRDISGRTLTAELSERFPVSPTGMHGWGINAVRKLLTNPVYCGDTSIGMRTKWQRGAFEQAAATIKRDACPAIVSRATWDAVQRQMLQRQRLRRHVRPNPGALSGVLFCGHCGYRLEKKSWKGKVYYNCSSYAHRPHLGCHGWRAREAEILPAICRELVAAVDFEVLKELQSNPRAKDTATIDRLREQAADLEKKVTRGSENLLVAAPEVFPELQRALLGWKTELEKVRNTISLALSDAGEQSEFLTWWESVKGRLVTVSEIVWGDAHTITLPSGETLEVEGPTRPAVLAEPEVLRSLLLKLNTRVTLSWKPKGKQYRLDKGLLELDLEGEKGKLLEMPIYEYARPTSILRCERVLVF